MARPKNNKLKEQIAKESWRQFRTLGYDGTSYSTIAEACGISRNLVQYHYPKKEMLSIAFMEQVLVEAQSSLGISEEKLHGDFRAIYEVGCCFFAFLLQENGYRTFLHDVIKSRERTQNVLSFNASWALARIDLPTGIDLEPILQEVIVSMGGFYELMYYCLQTGKPFAMSKRLAVVVEHFESAIAQASGSVDSQPDSLFDGELKGEVSRAVGKMNKRFGI